MKSVTLKLQRYLQDPACCAYAAAATVANFYNPEITYDYVYKLSHPDNEGLYTPDIAILMNRLGFKKVTVVSADIKCLDFQWAGMSKNKLIEQLKKVRRGHCDFESRDLARSYVNFLSTEKYDNSLLIDLHFGRYIRKCLSAKKPILASFNWNLFFNQPKSNINGEVDTLKGEYEEHEVVISGFDQQGVKVIDSHHESYKGKLSKFKRGRYKIDWETLHTVMGFGDLIIVDDYDKSAMEQHELV